MFYGSFEFPVALVLALPVAIPMLPFVRAHDNVGHAD